MQGLVAVALLLCCVNVSGLMLSKLHERQREFAVRTAIGAGSLRLARQYLTESFVIAGAGAALGAGAAWYGTPLMLPFFRTPMQGQGMLIEPDRTVFLVTALSAIGTTLFFGALPAWRAARGNPASVMKSRSNAGLPTAGAASSPYRSRCRSSSPSWLRCCRRACCACRMSTPDSRWIR